MKTIRLSDEVYRRIENLANAKGLSMKKAVEYAVRLTVSIDEAACPLQGNTNNLFTFLRDIPTAARREIARHIRILSRFNRSLFIMTEMLQEDLSEYKDRHSQDYINIKKGSPNTW